MGFIGGSGNIDYGRTSDRHHRANTSSAPFNEHVYLCTLCDSPVPSRHGFRVLLRTDARLTSCDLRTAFAQGTPLKMAVEYWQMAGEQAGREGVEEGGSRVGREGVEEGGREYRKEYRREYRREYSREGVQAGGSI